MRQIKRFLIHVWLLATLFVNISLAIKPLRNLEVVYRNQVYVISEVNTVDDLVQRLQRDSGISSDDIKSCRVIHKGNLLEKNQSLRQAGVQDGSSVVVLTENPKGTEALAIFLQMLNDKEWDRLKGKFKDSLKENDDSFDFDGIKELWKDSQVINRQDISDSIRNLLDNAYRKLRGGWEHPGFRRALHDTDRIEAYRQVIDKHLSKKILRDIPGAMQIVQNSDAWRQQMLKAASSILKAGDVVLDGILDVLLDVLKGAGKSKFGNGYGFKDHGFSSSSESQLNPMMEDPYKASDLLFELSESEDEN